MYPNHTHHIFSQAQCELCAILLKYSIIKIILLLLKNRLLKICRVESGEISLGIGIVCLSCTRIDFHLQ